MSNTLTNAWMPAAFLSGPHKDRDGCQVITDNTGQPPETIEFLGGRLRYIRRGKGRVLVYDDHGTAHAEDGVEYDVDRECDLIVEAKRALETANVEGDNGGRIIL